MFDCNIWLRVNDSIRAQYSIGRGAIVREWYATRSGVAVSIQASPFHYSLPKSAEPPYTHVEVLIGSDHYAPLLFKYAPKEDRYIDRWSVFPYVPVEVVNNLINYLDNKVDRFDTDDYIELRKE